MSDADLVQDTPEWLQARAGSIGASDVPDIIRRTKTGWSADRANKLALKTIERLTDVAVETYQSRAMLDGHLRQPLAISAYELMTDLRVEPVGLIRHPTIVGAHASPDGLVGEDGLIEVKCPQPSAHLAILLGDRVGRDYTAQMQWQMACTGRQWCDFVSWNPDFPPAMQLVYERWARNQEWIEELERQVVSFLVELDRNVAQLRHRYQPAEAA